MNCQLNELNVCDCERGHGLNGVVNERGMNGVTHEKRSQDKENLNPFKPFLN